MHLYQQDIGQIGVPIFFLISGFVITPIAIRQGMGRFAVNRALRIYVPLVFAVLLTGSLLTLGLEPLWTGQQREVTPWTLLTNSLLVNYLIHPQAVLLGGDLDACRRGDLLPAASPAGCRTEASRATPAVRAAALSVPGTPPQTAPAPLSKPFPASRSAPPQLTRRGTSPEWACRQLADDDVDHTRVEDRREPGAEVPLHDLQNDHLVVGDDVGDQLGVLGRGGVRDGLQVREDRSQVASGRVAEGVAEIATFRSTVPAPPVAPTWTGPRMSVIYGRVRSRRPSGASE